MRILQCSMMLVCFLICAGNVDASKGPSAPKVKSHVDTKPFEGQRPGSSSYNVPSVNSQVPLPYRAFNSPFYRLGSPIGLNFPPSLITPVSSYKPKLDTSERVSVKRELDFKSEKGSNGSVQGKSVPPVISLKEAFKQTAGNNLSANIPPAQPKQPNNKTTGGVATSLFLGTEFSSKNQVPVSQHSHAVGAPRPVSIKSAARGPVEKALVENMSNYQGRTENLVASFGFTPEQFVAPSFYETWVTSPNVAKLTPEQIAQKNIGEVMSHYTRQYANQPKEHAFIALNKDIQALRTETNAPEVAQELQLRINTEKNQTAKAKLTLLQKAQAARDQMNAEMIQQKVTEFMSEHAPSKGISIEKAIEQSDIMLQEVNAKNAKIDRSDVDGIVGEQSFQVADQVSTLLSQVQAEVNALRRNSRSDLDQALEQASRNKEIADRVNLRNPIPENAKKVLVWTQVVEQLKIDTTSATNAVKKIQDAVDLIVPGLRDRYLAEHHDPVIGALENLKLVYNAREHNRLITAIDVIKSRYDRSLESGQQAQGIELVVRDLNSLYDRNQTLSELKIYEKVVETLQPEMVAREKFLKDVEVKKEALRAVDKSAEEILTEAQKKLTEAVEKGSPSVEILRKVVEDLQVEHAVEKSAVEKNQDVENRAREKAEALWRDETIPNLDYIRKALQELSDGLQASALKNKITQLLEQYDRNEGIRLADFERNLVDIPEQTVHQKVEIILKTLNKENSPEVFKIYTKAIEKLNLKINAQAQRDVKVEAYLAKYNEITPRIIEDKIKALKNEQNKLNVQELDALRIKEIREFNEKVVNQEHKILLTTSREQLIELYEKVGNEFKALADRAWQEGNVHRAYQAVVNIGSNLRQGEVRQAAGLVPTAAGDITGALNDYVGAMLGPVKDNLSVAAKAAIAAIITATMPTLIAIISNNDLTEEEKQQMKKEALEAMMQDVLMTAVSDQTGADASAIMSGNMEAIATSSGINYFVNKLVPTDPNPYPYSYGSTSAPMSSVGSLNSTKNFQDKYNALAQQKALQKLALPTPQVEYGYGVKASTSDYSPYDASPSSSFLYTPTYTPSHSYSPSPGNQTSSYVSTPSPTPYSRVSTQDSPSFNGSSYSRSSRNSALPSYEELMAMPG